jgi:hypothetical protein
MNTFSTFEAIQKIVSFIGIVIFFASLVGAINSKFKKYRIVPSVYKNKPIWIIEKRWGFIFFDEVDSQESFTKAMEIMEHLDDMPTYSEY